MSEKKTEKLNLQDNLCHEQKKLRASWVILLLSLWTDSTMFKIAVLDISNILFAITVCFEIPSLTISHCHFGSVCQVVCRYTMKSPTKWKDVCHYKIMCFTMVQLSYNINLILHTSVSLNTKACLPKTTHTKSSTSFQSIPPNLSIKLS